MLAALYLASGQGEGQRRTSLGWWLGLTAAWLITAPAWLPWLDARQDLWAADDAAIHMIRLHHIAWLIGEGVWYPRWIPDMFRGYGYPLLNYYAPASYYVGWALRTLFGLDLWDAFRGAGVVAALLLSGGSYVLVTTVWRRVSLGLFAALTVAYGPYALQMNLYQRGNVPELLSLAWLPWLLATVWRLWHASGSREVAWRTVSVAVCGAGAVLAHNLTGMATAIVVAVWTGWLAIVTPDARWTRLARTASAGALVAGLTAFFWAPALLEARYVQLDRFQTPGLDYRQWLVDVDGQTERHQRPENRQTRSGPIDTHLHYPHQLVAPPKISLAQAALGALALGTLAPLRRRAAARPIVPLLGTAAVCWLLTLKESAPVWQVVPLLPVFQFPWRLLGPLAVCLAAAGAGALAALQNEARSRGRWGEALAQSLPAVVAVGVLFNSLGARQLNLASTPPGRFTARAVTAEEQDRGTGGTTGVAEFLPVTVRVPAFAANDPRVGPTYERLFPDLDWLGDRLRPLSGDVRVLSWRMGPHALRATVHNDGTAPAPLAIKQLWFPGWRAWIDGGRAAPQTLPDVPALEASLGVMVIDVPPGVHEVTLAFGPTTLRALATGLSLVIALVLAGVVWNALGRSRGAHALAAGAALLVLALGWRTLAPIMRPGPSAHEEGGLLLNVAEAARRGAATVSAPSGAALGPDSYVDVRSVAVPDASDAARSAFGTQRREWLYVHPPAEVSVDVDLPAGEEVWLQTALALDPSTWDAPAGDGVRFEVLVRPTAITHGVNVDEVVLRRELDPRARPEDRRWVPVAADLSRWAGQRVRLTLRTHPRDDPSFDWAGWGDPVVVVRESSRPLAVS